MFAENAVYAVDIGGIILFLRSFDGVRPNQHVAVRGVNDAAALGVGLAVFDVKEVFELLEKGFCFLLPRLRNARKRTSRNGGPRQPADLFVHNEVGAFSRVNGEGSVAGEVRNRVGKSARAVYDHFRFYRSVIRNHFADFIAVKLYIQNGGVQKHVHSVCRGVFSQSYGELIRRNDAARRHKYTSLRPARNVRFVAQQLFSRFVSEAFHSQKLCLNFECGSKHSFPFAVKEQHVTCSFEFDVQILAHFGVHFVAGNGVAKFLSVSVQIYADVHATVVTRRRAEGHVVVLF